MNCQYCGKKIGMIESWRYGRFCSKEHQDDFRNEATSLAASVLAARQGGGEEYPEDRQQSYTSLNKQKSPAGEPEPEADPPRMEAVGQEGATPVQWRPKPAPAYAEGRDRAANERHLRALKILAANDRTPPPVLEKDRRRRLKIEDDPYRFGEVVAPGARSVLVPPSGAVQKRPKLQFCERLLPLNLEQEAQAALPEFECLWDGAGEWTVEAADVGGMEFGDYLEDYTPEQPWEQWDWNALLEEAKYAQSMNEERDRRLNRLRSQQPAEAPQSQPGRAPAGPRQQGELAMPTYPGRMIGAQQAGQGQRSMPALNLAPGGMGGRGGGRPAMSAGRPGTAGQQPGALQQAGGPAAGGMTAPAMPSYPGRMVLRPAGGPSSGQMGPGGTGVAVQGGLLRIVPSIGAEPVAMEWVELAPPPFLALCKIDDPLPVTMPRQGKPVEGVHVDAVQESGEAKPGFAGAITPAQMAGICEELQPPPMPRQVAPPAFELKQTRLEAVGEQHEASLPEYRVAAGQFRIPPVQASDRRRLNLRPMARSARPDPGMGLDGRGRRAG
jgi:hypothetical protein